MFEAYLTECDELRYLRGRVDVRERVKRFLRGSAASCVILPAELPAATPSDNRLTPNQQTMYRVLHEAGPRGSKIGTSEPEAKASASDVEARAALHAKGLVTETMNGWAVNYEPRGRCGSTVIDEPST